MLNIQLFSILNLLLPSSSFIFTYIKMVNVLPNRDRVFVEQHVLLLLSIRSYLPKAHRFTFTCSQMKYLLSEPKTHLFYRLLVLKLVHGTYKSLLENIYNKQYYDRITSSFNSKLIFFYVI